LPFYREKLQSLIRAARGSGALAMPRKEKVMEYDKDKVDELTLALLSLVIHDETKFGARAWKGFDWNTIDRLHEKGWISNPVGKAKSVVLPSESVTRARELFEKHFGQSSNSVEPKSG
jgi:hypothetical protein